MEDDKDTDNNNIAVDNKDVDQPSTLLEMENINITSATNKNINGEEVVDKKDKKKKKKKDDGKEEVGPQVGFFEMFRFAEPLDWLLMFIGTIGAAANGASLPLMSIIFGKVMNDFTPANLMDPEFDLVAAVTASSMYFIWLGIGVFAASYAEISFFMLAGERQSVKCRKEYFKAIIRQNVGWYDTSKPSELSTRLASDSLLFQEAIGEKVSNLIHHLSTFISGFIVGFIYGWQLTLVILSLTPLIAAAGGFMANMMTTLSKKGQEAYAKAGALAEEKIGNIRTVSTFSGEPAEVVTYTERLQEALVLGEKKGLMNGLGMGAVFLIIFSSYSLSLWYGARLIDNKTHNPFPGRNWNGGDVLTVFLSVVMSSMSLGSTSPSVASISSGRGAAYKIFEIIGRKSEIDPFSTEGSKPNTGVQGDIEFRNVEFSYPSRPDVKIFKNFNLTIKKSQTVALVGDSGGGKSSVVGLLERFYNPDAGDIYLDGQNIKDLNVNWLRKNIGFVGQEPVLFALSICDNVRYGSENATMEQVIEACKTANAHDFISALPDGYNTRCGEKGVFLSGGQKQRIAIARAVIKNPSILLLDEATSALDSQNEFIIQAALSKLMVGRTTIVIAHRLSTIVDSDLIAVIKEGEIVEQGNHNELYQLGGIYTTLVDKQKSKKAIANQNGESGSNIIGADEESKDIKNVDIMYTDEDVKLKTELESITATKISGKDDDQIAEDDKKSEKSVPISRIMKLSKDEWPLFILGCIGAGVNGAVMPVFSIVFSEILLVFQEQDSQKLQTGARNMALWFFMIAVCAFLANIAQMYSFTAIGERLTYILRKLSFRSIMRQDIGWFDMKENSTGRLTTNLATEATLIQAITSQRLGLIVQNIVSVTVGLVIAFISGWKLTLVVLSLVPIIAFAGKVEMDFMSSFSKKSRGAYEECGSIASEAIGSIRTVSSFTLENQIINNFADSLEKPLKLSVKRAQVGGISFGFSHGALYFIYALAFWYGGKLVYQGEWSASEENLDLCRNGGFVNFGYPSEQTCMNSFTYAQGYSSLMRVFFAVLMSAMGVGQSMGFLPDIAKSKNAAIAIFKLIDRVSEIDPFILSSTGESPQQLRGNIEFKNIKFAYPSRPSKMVFNDFNLSIPAGNKVALVGDSGGGKSTVIGLLERFYNPIEGSITIDGIEIRDLNLNWLRSNLGLVGQEPFLFSGSIFDNIVYGKKDATMEQVIEAAKSANAHDFIDALPDKYQTQLGDKFTQLSGGQKQRVSIARAIIRNPSILLLDESTSALDNVSEKVVQLALDNVCKGRTSIVIAHRLSTVIDADIIVVLKDGKVVEMGNHESLLAQNGFYCQLVSRQI